MANGAAQFWTEVFVDASGAPRAGVKLYHYVAGTTTPKDVWADPLKQTPASNPVVGDSAGRVSFYADGDYRLKVTTNDDQLLYDWDHVRITQDTATMWEGDRGTALPSVSTLNQGQLFALTDSPGDLVDLHFRGATQFTKVPASLSPVAFASLPAAGSSGRIRMVTDKTRGLWFDNGSAWISVSGRAVDVREFGAVGNGSTNDTAAIQAALNALEDGGVGGVCFCPPGAYLVTNLLIPSKVHLQGAGPDASSIISTATSGIKGILANKNQIVGNNRIKITDLSIIRAWDSASSHAFNEAVYMRLVEYLWIERCIISGAASAFSSFDAGVHLQDCTHAWVNDNYISNFAGEGIYLSKTTQNADWDAYITVANNIFRYGNNWQATGILCENNHVDIVGNIMRVASGSSVARFVQLQRNPKIVTISGNNCDYANVVYAISGERIDILSNTCKRGGIYFDNSDTSSGSSPTVREVMIAGNHVIEGNIRVSKTNTSGTCDRVSIKNNVVASNPSASVAGIQMEGCVESDVIGNTVRRSSQNGIVISGVDWVCSGNFVTRSSSNGYVITCTALQYAEITPASKVATFFQGNSSRENGTYGFSLQVCAKLTFMGNFSRADGTGEYTWGGSITAVDAQPVLLFEGEHLAAPEGVVYAGPGSTLRCLASGAPGAGATRGLWVKRSGYGATGWHDVDQTGDS